VIDAPIGPAIRDRGRKCRWRHGGSRKDAVIPALRLAGVGALNRPPHANPAKHDVFTDGRDAVGLSSSESNQAAGVDIVSSVASSLAGMTLLDILAGTQETTSR